MPALINTKTLLDISRHSNKIVRLSQLMDQIEAGYLVNQMGYLYKESDPMDIVLAFNKDLGTTANMLRDVALIVESVDDDGRALELTGDENDLNALFPEHWDNDTKTLTLFNYPISRRGGTSTAKADEIKEVLYHKIMGETAKEFPYKAFKKHVTAMRTLEKTERPSSEAPFHEALSYANQLSSVELWQPFYEAAIATTGHFREFRRSLSDKERQTVDEKIYSGRAMIDGVVKDSTYITMDGQIQTATPHKSNKQFLNAIEKMVKELDFIRAVEIDRDTDIVKFHDMLVDISRMGLDFPDAFELKSRKLGNYRACGISSVRGSITEEYGFANADLRIVAVDVNYPTSLSHEVTHFRDRENTLHREEMINHFRAKIDVDALEELYPGKVGYYMSGREVLARMGEIGFMLNQFGYKDGESLEDFRARVVVDRESVVDDDKARFNVSLSKTLERYIGEEDVLSQYIYFDMANWQPDEMSLLRDFTHDFFYKHDPEIARKLKERIDNGLLNATSLNYQKIKDQGKSKRERRELSDSELLEKSFNKMQPNELLPTYKAGVAKGLFKDGEFFEAMSPNMMKLFGLAKKNKASITISYEGMYAQVQAIKELASQINVSERPGDALIATRVFAGYAVGVGAIDPASDPQFSTLGVSDKFLLNAGELTMGMLEDAPEDEIQTPDISHVSKFGSKYWRISGSSEVIEKIRSDAEELTRDLFARVYKDNTVIPAMDVTKPVPSTDAANWLKVTSLFHQEFNGYLPDEETHDWQYDMMKHSRMNALVGGDVSVKQLAELAENASWAKLLSMPELKYHVSKSSELQLVDRMLDSGVMDELGITKKDVFDFVALHDHLPTIKAETASDIFKEWARPQLDSPAMLGDDTPLRETFGLGLYRREPIDSGKVLSHAPITSFLNMCMNKTKLGGQDTLQKLTVALTKAGMENPLLDKAIDNFIDKRVEDFNKTRAKLIVANGGAAASMNHPMMIALESQLFEGDMLAFDVPGAVKPTDMAKSILKQSLLASYMTESTSENPAFIQGYVKPVIEKKMEWCRVREGSSYESETTKGLVVVLETLTRTLQGVPVLDMTKDPANSYLQDRSKPGREKLRAKADAFLERAIGIDPAATAMLLQATTVLASPESSLPLLNKHHRGASLDVCQMSAALSTPLLEDGVYFGDMRPMVSEISSELQSVNHQTLPQTPEEPDVRDVKNKHDGKAPELVVEEVKPDGEQLEYFAKINEDVEVTPENTPFSERNQMRLF